MKSYIKKEVAKAPSDYDNLYKNPLYENPLLTPKVMEKLNAASKSGKGDGKGALSTSTSISSRRGSEVINPLSKIDSNKFKDKK